MENDTVTFSAKVTSGIGKLIRYAVYIIFIGAVIAVWYGGISVLIFLAGNTIGDIPWWGEVVYVLWPLWIVVTAFLGIISFALDDEHKRNLLWPTLFMSGWIGFYFLPALANGISKITAALQFTATAEFVHDYRWWGQPIILGLFLFLALGFLASGEYRDRKLRYTK